ncbi:alkaline shock response membrane anchor protein AmaP (plasmid) [Staphylococcus sp. IVB6181]|mgnify:FL=1|uniref:alkaline shock response membrane anchor protein AmaP n=1 Tax=Staphylococcus TaxID=1279 RepID=UPI001E384DE4|nr:MULTISPECIES: alkaline shock response membrane anchor protein AmaP [Staphylococcus]MCD8915850.1 alkaline shock response membrane anchor protein AmaP [Staphylococcus simulans]UXV36292.1 alkaline shock response membrane anchor protein AmaP [Staphylococcus sp. IVB6181]UXV43751.1 alkaline shock response membrane anchor protein AmaP [Staphylococcus simulans]
MRRLKNFILGILIVAVVGMLVFMLVKVPQVPQVDTYQQQLLTFAWFLPVLFTLAGLLILLGIILIFSLFAPTHRKPGLYKIYSDGHIYISRKSIDKVALDTMAQYDQLMQPNVVTKCYSKKKKSYIDLKADFFLPDQSHAQTITENVRTDIKKNVEYFAEVPIRKLEVNVKDQKSPSSPRVL